MDTEDIAAAAESLRALLASILAGEIEATDVERAHIAGALSALESVADRTG